MLLIADYEYISGDYVIGRCGTFEDAVCRKKDLIVIRETHDEACAYDGSPIGPFYCDGGFHLQPGKNWIIRGFQAQDHFPDGLPDGRWIPDGLFAECIDNTGNVMFVCFEPYSPASVSSTRKNPLDALFFGTKGKLVDVNIGLDNWIIELQRNGHLTDVRKVRDLKHGAKARYEILTERSVWKKLCNKELLELVKKRHDRNIHSDFIQHPNNYPELMKLPPASFYRPRKRKVVPSVHDQEEDCVEDSEVDKAQIEEDVEELDSEEDEAQIEEDEVIPTDDDDDEDYAAPSGVKRNQKGIMKRPRGRPPAGKKWDPMAGWVDDR